MPKREVRNPVWKIDAQNVMRCRIMTPRPQRSSIVKDLQKRPSGTVDNPTFQQAMSSGTMSQKNSNGASHQASNDDSGEDRDDNNGDVDNDNGGGGDIGIGGVEREEEDHDDEDKEEKQQQQKRDQESGENQEYDKNGAQEATEAKANNKVAGFKWFNRGVHHHNHLFNGGHKIVGIASSVDSSSGDHTASEISSSVFLSPKGSFDFDLEDADDTKNKWASQEKSETLESLPDDDSDSPPDDVPLLVQGNGSISVGIGDDKALQGNSNTDGKKGGEPDKESQHDADILETDEKCSGLEILFKDNVVHYKPDRSSRFDTTYPVEKNEESNSPQPVCETPSDIAPCDDKQNLSTSTDGPGVCYNVNAYYSFDDHRSPNNIDSKETSFHFVATGCSRSITKRKYRSSDCNRSHDISTLRFGKIKRFLHSPSTMSRSETIESRHIKYCFRTISGVGSESLENSNLHTYEGWGNWSRAKAWKCITVNKSLHVDKRHESGVISQPHRNLENMEPKMVAPKQIEPTRLDNVLLKEKRKSLVTCGRRNVKKFRTNMLTFSSTSKLVSTPYRYSNNLVTTDTGSFTRSKLQVYPTTSLLPAPSCYKRIVLNRKRNGGSSHNLVPNEAPRKSGDSRTKPKLNQKTVKGTTSRDGLHHEIKCLYLTDPYVHKNKNYNIRVVPPPRRTLATSKRGKAHLKPFQSSNVTGKPSATTFTTNPREGSSHSRLMVHAKADLKNSITTSSQSRHLVSNELKYRLRNRRTLVTASQSSSNTDMQLERQMHIKS